MNSKLKIRHITFAILAIAITACAEKGVKLGEAELRVLLENGQSISWKVPIFSGLADFRTDGSARLTVTGRGEDEGKWWIEGNLVCSKWRIALNKAKTCASIGKLADGSYEARHPKTKTRLGTFTLRK